jgi:hypothetical protein
MNEIEPLGRSLNPDPKGKRQGVRRFVCAESSLGFLGLDGLDGWKLWWKLKLYVCWVFLGWDGMEWSYCMYDGEELYCAIAVLAAPFTHALFSPQARWGWRASSIPDLGCERFCGSGRCG